MARPLDRGAELRRRSGRASSIRMRSPNETQVRREVGAGAQPVVGQDRRDHPRGRGLAVGPDDVDRLKSRSGWPSAVISRRIRSRPNRIPNSSSGAGAQRSAPRAHASASRPHGSQAPPAPPAAAPACRARPGRPRGRLGHERLVGELALGALDLGVELGAPLGQLALAAPCASSSAPARISTWPPGIGTAATGSAPLRGAVEAEAARDGRRARSCPRSRAPRAAASSMAPALTPATSRQRRSAWMACDRPLHGRLGGLVDLAGPRRSRHARGQQALGAGDVGVDLLGLERDQRVREGDRLGEHVQQRRRSARARRPAAAA